MGKKGGKKAKGPTYYVEDAHCIPFGFRANDIIKTPLGLTGTVIGVKYENPDDKTTGRLWVGTFTPPKPNLSAPPANPTHSSQPQRINAHIAWNVLSHTVNPEVKRCVNRSLLTGVVRGG